jgi:hypothetical protein
VDKAVDWLLDGGFETLQREEAQQQPAAQRSQAAPPPAAPAVAEPVHDNPLVCRLVDFGGASLEDALWAVQRGNSVPSCLWLIQSRQNGTEEHVPQRDCIICMGEFPANEMVQMECKPDPHWLCEPCFGAGLKTRIDAHCVDDPETGTAPGQHLTCQGICCAVPCEGCHINPHMVVKHVDEADGKKFCDLRLRHEVEQGLWKLQPGERIVLCPRQCGFAGIVERDQDLHSAQCVNPECETDRFCGLCWQKPHIQQEMGTADEQDITCDEYLEWLREQDGADEAMDKYNEEKGNKACPECDAMTEKNLGCNYMTCLPCTAAGKGELRFWCWVTGKHRHGPDSCGGGHGCH